MTLLGRVFGWWATVFRLVCYRFVVVQRGWFCVLFAGGLSSVVEDPVVLVELGLVEQRHAAVLEVLNEGVSVAEVARRYGFLASRCIGGFAGMWTRV